MGSFGDLFDDLEEMFERGERPVRRIPDNYFWGEGYGATIAEAYVSMLSAKQPLAHLDGVYAPHAIPLDPPDVEQNELDWCRGKLAELVEPGRVISFGYVDPYGNKGRIKKKFAPGVKRYKFFGITADPPRQAEH
jgi:hypothetical protein